MKPNLIFDFETLSKEPWSAPIVNFAYIVFDEDRVKSVDNQYSLEELMGMVEFHKFDLREQIDSMGKIATKDTLDWWKEQNAETQKQLQPSSEDISLNELPDIVVRICEQHGYWMKWWSRGNSFDPVVLHVEFKRAGYDLNDFLKYGMVRDTRSWIDGATDGGVKTTFTPDGVSKELMDQNLHEPSFDISLDVLRLQTIWREIYG